MITTEQMRIFIMKLYPGDKWPAKCKAMSDAQVYSTYTRITKGKNQ